MKPWIKSDERTEEINGRIALIFLVLTQVGLLISILLQRYLWSRPPAYYNLTAVILGASIAGFWIANLVLGGLLPELSARKLLMTYGFLVLGIALPYALIRGFPQGGEWLRWGLVMLGGPAVFMAGCALAAALGRKRLERQTRE